MKRSMDFTMSRPNLVKAGQEVEITEGILKTAGNYYYTIEPAVAMSANYRKNQRLVSRKGVVTEVGETPRGYFVRVEFDEPDKRV